MWSRPSRARGLKLLEKNDSPPALGVAPLAGAWIETPLAARNTPPSPVAPLAGAWIETGTRHGAGGHVVSRPSRARGLKLLAARQALNRRESRPSRARGLKLYDGLIHTLIRKSRPSRARGLKLQTFFYE